MANPNGPGTKRLKGRTFQKKIYEKLKEIFELSDDDIRVPIGCEQGVDIKLSEFGRKRVGLSVECKNSKKLSIFSALEQAKSNNYGDCEPAVVFHRSESGNRENWICVPLDHYLDIRRELDLRRRMEVSL